MHHFNRIVQSTFSKVYNVFSAPYIRPYIERSSIATLPRCWQDRLFADCLTLRATEVVPGLLAACANAFPYFEDNAPTIFERILTARISAPTIQATAWPEIIRDLFGDDVTLEDSAASHLKRLREEILWVIADTLTGGADHSFTHKARREVAMDETYYQFQVDQREKKRARAKTFGGAPSRR